MNQAKAADERPKGWLGFAGLCPREPSSKVPLVAGRGMAHGCSRSTPLRKGDALRLSILTWRAGWMALVGGSAQRARDAVAPDRNQSADAQPVDVVIDCVAANGTATASMFNIRG